MKTYAFIIYAVIIYSAIQISNGKDVATKNEMYDFTTIRDELNPIDEGCKHHLGNNPLFVRQLADDYLRDQHRRVRFGYEVTVHQGECGLEIHGLLRHDRSPVILPKAILLNKSRNRRVNFDTLTYNQEAWLYTHSGMQIAFVRKLSNTIGVVVVSSGAVRGVLSPSPVRIFWLGIFRAIALYSEIIAKPIELLGAKLAAEKLRRHASYIWYDLEQEMRNYPSLRRTAETGNFSPSLVILWSPFFLLLFFFHRACGKLSRALIRYLDKKFPEADDGL